MARSAQAAAQHQPLQTGGGVTRVTGALGASTLTILTPDTLETRRQCSCLLLPSHREKLWLVFPRWCGCCWPLLLLAAAGRWQEMTLLQ